MNCGLVGRPRLPARIHLLRGNPSNKTPAELASELQVDAGLPEAPEWLGPVALAEYHRVGAELVRYGLVSLIDRGVLTQMAVEWERICWAQQKIAEMNAADPHGEAGLVATTPNGYKVNSVYVNLLRGAQSAYIAACNLMGCTPAARAKLKSLDTAQMRTIDAAPNHDVEPTIRSFAA